MLRLLMLFSYVDDILTIYAWYEFRVYDAARVSAVSLWLEEAVMSLDTCDFVLVDSTRVNVEFLDSYCSSSLPETSSKRERQSVIFERPCSKATDCPRVFMDVYPVV